MGVREFSNEVRQGIMPEGRRRLREQRAAELAAEQREGSPASERSGGQVRETRGVGGGYQGPGSAPATAAEREAEAKKRKARDNKVLAEVDEILEAANRAKAADADMARFRAEILKELAHLEELEEAAALQEDRRRMAARGVLLPGAGASHAPAVRESAVRRAGPAKIEVRESSVYANGGWVLDQLALRIGAYGGVGDQTTGPGLGRRRLPSVEEATTRQSKYLDEISYEIRHRSAEGMRYRAVLSEEFRAEHGSAYDRSGDALAELVFDWRSGNTFAAPAMAHRAMPSHMAAEFRAVSTGSGSMGAFAPPVYHSDEPVLARAFGPIQAQAMQAELGASGMSFSYPAVSLAYASGVQSSENTSALAINPTASFVTGQVQTSTRAMPLSQQLLDRSAMEIDLLVARQAGLHAAVDIDVASINAVLAVATSITNSGTAGVTTLWGDVAKAAAGFTSTDGTALPATHVFMSATLMKWYQSQIGSDGRPIWMPTASAGAAHAGTVGSSLEGYTGYDVHGAATFEDAHIPPTTGNSTVLVGDFRDGLLVARAEPVVEIFPEFQAATLTAIARHRQYFGVAVLYPAAFAQITGAAYPASPTFA